MNLSYWSSSDGANRLSRRGFVGAAATGGFAAAAAGVVGCSSTNTKNVNAGTKPSASAVATGQSAAATPAATRAGTPNAQAAGGRTTTPAALDSTKGKPGGTLKVYFQGYPPNFSTVETQSTYTQLGFAHSALLQQAWGVAAVDPYDFGNLQPDVASTLPEQPDDTTLIFKIRPDVRFQNGRTLTIDDVKYSIDRVANYDKSVYRQTWQYFLDHTETPDSQTFVVKTKAPFGDALIAFSGNQNGYMLAKEFEEGSQAATTVMGAGPFILANSTAPVSLTYKKNPDFYDKPYPYFDQLVMLFANDTTKQLADFSAHQVNMPYRVSPGDAQQIRKARPDAKEQTWEFASTAVMTRADKPPFNDKRVRQALNMTIDRKKIRDAVSVGQGRDDQFFTVSFQKLFGFRDPKNLPQANLWDFNAQAAKQLLAAAGVDKPLEATMLHYDAAPAGQWFPDTATLIQATWQELGIANVKDDQRPAALIANATQTGMYDSMILIPNNGFPQGPTFVAELKDKLYWDPTTGKSLNNNSWTHNDQINTLLNKQLGQLKLDDRKQTYREMEPIMADEANYLCQSTITRSFFWDPTIQNASMNITQGAWRYMMKWWFA